VARRAPAKHFSHVFELVGDDPEVSDGVGNLPDVDNGEKVALRWFLQAQRDSVLAIVEGLDDTALTTTVLPSGWTPLGLIEHLGHAERHWFQEVAMGSAVSLPWSGNDPPLTTLRSPQAVFAFYREQCARSDALLAGGRLDDAAQRPDDAARGSRPRWPARPARRECEQRQDEPDNHVSK
jgi:hypothetical protein